MTEAERLLLILVADALIAWDELPIGRAQNLIAARHALDNEAHAEIWQARLAAQLVAAIDASNAPPTLEARVVADETTAPTTNVSTPPPNIFDPASE